MSAEEVRLGEQGSRLSRLIRNPLFGTVGGLAGIVAVPLSIYLYLAGRAVRDLTYYVSPTRTAIVTDRPNQKLAVSYAGQAVQGDISSAQITIWNAGKKPIRHSDLLTPLTLIFPAHNRILNAKVLNVTRPLIGFNGDFSRADSGALTLDWRILEHDDGFRLQVIYVGHPNAKILLKGAIVGQRTPSSRSPASNEVSAALTGDKRISLVALGVAFSVAGLAAMVLAAIGRRKGLQRSLVLAAIGRRKGLQRSLTRSLRGFPMWAAGILYFVGAIAMFATAFAHYLNAPPWGY